MVPEEPNYQEVKALLNKVLEARLPNWNTGDLFRVYKCLEQLSFYWFRK